MAVVISGLIPGVEPKLLVDCEAWDRDAADRADGEAIPWVLEVAAVDVCLASLAVGVEDDRVEIDPTAGVGDQFNANGAPVGLDLEAETSEGFDGGCLVLGVEIPMGAGLATSRNTRSAVAVALPARRVSPRRN